MYYTAEEYFKNKFDATYRPFAFRAQSSKEYTKWKKDFKPLLERLLGFQNMSFCDPDIAILSFEDMGDYTREKLLITTEPGIKMPFYLLKPKHVALKEKFPIMIAPHGHESNGKNAVCGNDMGSQEIKNTIRKYNYDYGIQFVKEGFIVFCPDARGFGERAEKYTQNQQSLLESSCAYLNAMAYPLGLNVTGMWTWDLMRLLDYALTRNDVDVSRINCAGLSGGGLQTLWFGAMDERVKTMIISGYFYGYKQSILEEHHCSCNYVPELWNYADIGDVAALLANRNVFIETGDKDEINGREGLRNVTSQVEIVKGAARLLDNQKNVTHHVFSGPHKWCGKEAVPWITHINFKEALPR